MQNRLRERHGPFPRRNGTHVPGDVAVELDNGATDPMAGGSLGSRLPASTLSATLRRQRDGTRPLRVRLAGKLLASAAPGGGETQLTAVAQALGELGVDARPWRPWEDAWSDVDCLHLVGSLPEHLPLVETARRHGIPVVLSPVTWFDVQSRWHAAVSYREALRGCLGLAARRTLPAWRDWRARLYRAVDLLLPNSIAEAAQLNRLFRVPNDKIHVVPNGADPRFAHGDAQMFARLAGKRHFARNFVLYAGRIEPRKNQLGFLRAMRGTGVPIVVLGDVAPGHESYLARCRRAAGREVTFVGRIPHDDPLLASAYAACGCLALVSWFETPGLVALEAAMSGAPLVLTDRGSAPEYFGPLATYVAPNNPAAIRAAVCAALHRDRNRELAELVRGGFTWKTAAEATREAYERIC